MARAQSRFVCQACGADFLRWEGQCRSCAAWNTLVETVVTARAAARAARTSATRAAGRRGAGTPLGGGRGTDRAPLDGHARAGPRPGRRHRARLAPADRRRARRRASRRCSSRSPAASPARRTRRGVLYATGEESAAQLRLRAARLGLGGGPAADAIDVLATSEVGAIVEAARARRPALVVVDSIQTMTVDELDGPAGSVGQVRESALRLMELAKGEGIAVVLVGHVTKDGSIAGPRTLEHLVDAVIDLGGERGGVMRLVRASKNRFGSTDELGVLEMGEDGLREVADPGRAFLAEHDGAAPGSVVAATLEGTPAAARRGPGARLAGGLRHARAPRVGHRPDPARAPARGARPAGRRRPRHPRRLREPRRRPHASPSRASISPWPSRSRRRFATGPSTRARSRSARSGCSASSGRCPAWTAACARRATRVRARDRARRPGGRPDRRRAPGGARGEPARGARRRPWDRRIGARRAQSGRAGTNGAVRGRASSKPCGA